MSVVSGRQATGFLTNNASPELCASLKMTAALYLEDWSRMTARTRYLTFHTYIFNMWQYLDHRLYWTCVLFVFSWRRTMNMNASQVAEVLGCNYPVACLSMGSPKSPWYGTWWYTMGLQGCHFFKSYHCSRFLVLLSSWIFGGFRINCAIKSAVPAVS